MRLYIYSIKVILKKQKICWLSPPRLVQLNKLYHKYEISLIYPKKLTFDSGWLSGFFDGDSKVTINSTNTQLSIALSQKISELLQPLLEIYGGNIYIDRGSSLLWDAWDMNNFYFLFLLFSDFIRILFSFCFLFFFLTMKRHLTSQSHDVSHDVTS